LARVSSQAPAAVIMAAGLGTRMRSATPKHLHALLGRRVVDWVIGAARDTGAEPIVVVASSDTRDAYDGLEVAVQEQPLGTGDAVASARDALAGFDGKILVLDAAAPLLTAKYLTALVEEHERQGAAVTILSVVAEGLPYGRIVRDENGLVREIVEEGDATPEQRSIQELNSSIYVFEASWLWPALDKLDPHNAQGELYLTDCIGGIVDAGGRAAAWPSPNPLAALGINNRAELAVASGALRERINEQHMLSGVTIVDPASTWIEADVELAADCVVHPFTVLRGRTQIAAGAEIGPHAVVVDAIVGERTLVGPFCYLRPGAVLGADVKAGTFVEMKEARIGDRTKVPHLSYIGDAEVGEDTNIAAGNITANYRPEVGPGKQRTTIGRNVRTGVDNAFIAPVTIGDNAWVAAGSVITEDVPPDALAIARARQENKEGFARGKRND
jgi:bifunctional UDP-N-acetylglucosamine pyrophosphorylase/glucosamine-1-phosphate N-acetyltransferase